MSERVQAIVDDSMASVTGEGVNIDGLPEELKRSIARHQGNLMSLAASLLAGGQPEDMVRMTIDTVFASYRDELAKTIVALRAQTEKSDD